MTSPINIPVIATITALVILFVAMSVMSLFFFIYWKRRQSSLPHLDKHHKESEENSYSSSKNSRDSSPKGRDSFNPVYDEIKLKHSQRTTNYKSCTESDDDKLNDLHYSIVYSKVGSEQNKTAVCCGSNHACSQLSKNSQTFHVFSEEIKDQSHENASINCTNDVIDNSNSENYETHTYALVDMKKKKTEDVKIQELCVENYTDSGGGTPPPVPPHTPEMFTNDSDSNTRHDENSC